MRIPKNALRVSLFWMLLLFIIPYSPAQTKRVKRPKSNVGITSVDRFVKESFDIYDKVYKYDSYAQSGTPLDDSDLDVLQDALDDLEGLSTSAPNVLTDLEGQSVIKQGKATLNITKAKKALSYSLKTTKNLLTGKGSSSETPKTNEGNGAETNIPVTGTDVGEVEEVAANISDNLEVYSKYDFVPGDKLIFFDDFSQDFVGDFPSKWNTNATGEVVKIGDENWFELKSGYRVNYMPDVKDLPEDYTIEFDLLTRGLSKSTSSTARLFITLTNSHQISGSGGDTQAIASIPFGQYAPFGISVKNYFNSDDGYINSTIKADLRKAVLNKPHIAIAVNSKRYRLWVNQVKYVDIPRFIQELDVLNYIMFHLNNFKDGEEHLYIRNLKVAEGGVDLRRKLLSEGKISTNGILFDSGSANIQPQSLGIVRQISQVLTQDESIKLNIIGHTDSDGSDEANLKLSKARADAVKKALIDIYSVSADRLQTDGKGESIPVGDNTTPEGKSQNRRVEFVKI